MVKEGSGTAQPKQRTALILTALPEEFKAVVQHLEPLGKGKAFDQIKTHYFLGTFQTAEGETWVVYVAESGAGNLFSANLASAAIGKFKPDIAIYTGIAGALKPDELGKGGVVAGSEVCYLEYGSIGENNEHRPVDFRCAHQLIEAAKAVAREDLWQKRRKGSLGKKSHPPRAMVGMIAVGEKVLKSTNSDYYRKIRERFPKAVAYEIEGAGFMSAAHQFNTVPSIVIRSISDELNDKSKTDKEGWQLIAASNVAAFVFELINSVPPDDDLNNPVLSKGPNPTEPDSGFQGGIIGIDVCRNDMPRFYAIMRDLSKISRGPVVPKPSEVAFTIAVYGQATAGKSTFINGIVSHGFVHRQIELEVAQIREAARNLLRDVTRAEQETFRLLCCVLGNTWLKQRTNPQVLTGVAARVRQVMDRVLRYGVKQFRPPRSAPSIIVREESVLFGRDDRTFAIRVYLDERGSFVNIRPNSGLAAEICSVPEFGFAQEGLGKDGRPARSINMPQALVGEADELDLGPCADAVLCPSGAMRATHDVLTSRLGFVYGESEPIDGTPYVRGLKGFSGGACAQACVLMASTLLHDRVPMVGTGARIHGLAETAALARGVRDGSSRLDTITLADMIRYLQMTGKTASLERVVVRGGINDSVNEYSRLLRACIKERLPVIAIVNSDKISGLDDATTTNSSESGKVNHAVLVVGVSKSGDEFLINDPAGEPFTPISATLLFESGLCDEGGVRSARFVCVSPSIVASDGIGARNQVYPAIFRERRSDPMDRFGISLMTWVPERDLSQIPRDSWLSRKISCHLVIDDRIDEVLKGFSIIDSLGVGRGKNGQQNQRGVRSSTSIEAVIHYMLDYTVALYCHASGLASDVIDVADESVERASRAILLARETRLRRRPSGENDVLPVIVSVGSRVSTKRTSEHLQSDRPWLVALQPMVVVLDSLESRLEEIVRSSGLAFGEGIYLALDLEPGPFFAINGLSVLRELSDRIAKNAWLSQIVGFNLDIAHFMLAGVEPIDLAREDNICGRIIHMNVSDHGPGHFGDLPIGDGCFGRGADSVDKLAPFKEWFALLFDRILNSPQASRVLPFSRQISVELESGRTTASVSSSIELLRKLIDGDA
ncbi:MAG: hypothetical protein JWP03_1434 [Phycisphaerales bacterium]|nr:hypothetical protein [Phycisphaerales bacterium]